MKLAVRDHSLRLCVFAFNKKLGLVSIGTSYLLFLNAEAQRRKESDCCVRCLLVVLYLCNNAAVLPSFALNLFLG